MTAFWGGSCATGAWPGAASASAAGADTEGVRCGFSAPTYTEAPAAINTAASTVGARRFNFTDFSMLSLG
jgi:hypothetical protein